MLARLRKAKENGEGGFTLIELLVVMIIIGILAAIAIPVFLSQREKAQDSAAKADVSTIGKEVASFYVDHVGAPALTIDGDRRYKLTLAVTDTQAAVDQDLGKASTNVVLATASATTPDTSGTGSVITSDTKWCVAVNNPNGDKKTFKYSYKGGLEAGNCLAADVA